MSDILHFWLLIIYQIVSNIGEKIGTVWKKWPGFNDERNMDHEYFGLDGEFYQSQFYSSGSHCGSFYIMYNFT